MYNRKELENHARAFKAGILAIERNSLPPDMRSFPRGVCGDASLMLAKYLREMGCGNFDYVVGVREHDGQDHAWLQQGSIIVDITADQFHENKLKVIFSEDDVWYRQYEEDLRHVADYGKYDARTVGTLDECYNFVLEKIVEDRYDS